MTTHFARNLDASPLVVSPSRGKGGSPHHPEPVGSSDRHLFFEVDFDPKRNYLRELKNERGERGGRS